MSQMDSFTPTRNGSLAFEQTSLDATHSNGYSMIHADQDEAGGPKNVSRTTQELLGLSTSMSSSARLGVVGILLTALVSLMLLLVWTVYSTPRGVFADLLAPAVIGGSLTYVQAKAIDFVCSALLGPLVMVCLDFVWFRSARTTVVNDKRVQNGVPLQSLVYTSNTGSGGFDPFKLKSLLSAGGWALTLFAFLFVLSGIAGKLLNNVVAYQAFNSTVTTMTRTPLRQLSGATLQLYDTPSSDEMALLYTNLSQFSVPQRAAVANQLSALLTSLNIQSAEFELESDSSYVGINATIASINSLEPNIVELLDVPAYRLSVECSPYNTTYFAGVQLGALSYNLEMGNAHPGLWMAQMPGISTLNSALSGYPEHSIVLFNPYANATYLGLMYKTNGNTSVQINSSYGPVSPYGTNWKFTVDETAVTRVVTTWGISCTLWRQQGTTKLVRQVGGSWTRASNNFKPEKVSVNSMLYQYQLSLNYNAPLSTTPGLGPALSNTAASSVSPDGPSCLVCDPLDPTPLNFTIYANNFLYASGEARRITYEALANESNGTPDLFYNVTSTALVQHYRITYIPLLLLLALTTMFLAALIPIVLASSAYQSAAFRSSRDLDGLRLVVDAVVGLQDSAAEMAEASGLKSSDLAKWANGIRVRILHTEQESAEIRLARVGGLKSE